MVQTTLPGYIYFLVHGTAHIIHPFDQKAPPHIPTARATSSPTSNRFCFLLDTFFFYDTSNLPCGICFPGICFDLAVFSAAIARTLAFQQPTRGAYKEKGSVPPTASHTYKNVRPASRPDLTPPPPSSYTHDNYPTIQDTILRYPLFSLSCPPFPIRRISCRAFQPSSSTITATSHLSFSSPLARPPQPMESWTTPTAPSSW